MAKVEQRHLNAAQYAISAALCLLADAEARAEKAEALLREALQYVDECARSSMGAGLVARGIRAHLKEHDGKG